MPEYDNTNRGALFKNDRKEKDTHPDATGNLMVKCPHCEQLGSYFIDAWTKKIENGDRVGQKMQSLSVKAKDKQPGGKPAAKPTPKPAPADDDDVPF